MDATVNGYIFCASGGIIAPMNETPTPFDTDTNDARLRGHVADINATLDRLSPDDARYADYKLHVFQRTVRRQHYKAVERFNAARGGMKL